MSSKERRMGNIALSACLGPIRNPRPEGVKLVFYGGATELLLPADSLLAGEVLFRYPDRIVCPADSFFIGRPVPALAIGDPLLAGRTYLVLPVDRLPSNRALTVASLASLSDKVPTFAGATGRLAFEYVKGKDGRMMIKVCPEFIIKAITAADGEDRSGSTLCTTPELRKQYEQLVSPNARAWSPRLETISEKKAKGTELLSTPSRLSPVRSLFGKIIPSS